MGKKTLFRYTDLSNYCNLRLEEMKQQSKIIFTAVRKVYDQTKSGQYSCLGTVT
jgi:hypothetical protein